MVSKGVSDGVEGGPVGGHAAAYRQDHTEALLPSPDYSMGSALTATLLGVVVITFATSM